MSARTSKRAKAHIRYRLKDGKTVPGVTTILGVLAKPALIPWANRLGLQGIDVSRYVDDKAAIGSLAHDMILCHFRGEEPCDTSDYSQNQIDQAENALLSFFSWAKQHEIEPILCEEPLVSEGYRYGGTIDLYCNLDDEPCLVDFKTGSGIYEEHFFQCAAYMELLGEHDHPVESVRILNIPRAEDEKFREEYRKDLTREMQIFRACLEIYRLRQAIREG